MPKYKYIVFCYTTESIVVEAESGEAAIAKVRKEVPDMDLEDTSWKATPKLEPENYPIFDCAVCHRHVDSHYEHYFECVECDVLMCQQCADLSDERTGLVLCDVCEQEDTDDRP